eukprot:COSAG01_NODE_8890_length_2625_cov_2.093032_2_plen_177_part_00
MNTDLGVYHPFLCAWGALRIESETLTLMQCLVGPEARLVQEARVSAREAHQAIQHAMRVSRGVIDEDTDWSEVAIGARRCDACLFGADIYTRALKHSIQGLATRVSKETLLRKAAHAGPGAEYSSFGGASVCARCGLTSATQASSLPIELRLAEAAYQDELTRLQTLPTVASLGMQ